VGSMSNFGDLSGFVKFINTVYMLLGRLEIFGFIQIFLIRWWR